MSSVPTSFYGIYPNDDHDPRQNFMAPIDASFHVGSGEPFYPTPFDGLPVPSFRNPNNISTTHEELPAFLTNGVTVNDGQAPAFPTYSAVPHSQTPFPFAMTSSPFVSRTSPESTLAPAPSPSRGNRGLHQCIRGSKDTYAERIAAYLSKSKRAAHTRRTRGLTSKGSGAGFRKMFVRSSRKCLN